VLEFVKREIVVFYSYCIHGIRLRVWLLLVMKQTTALKNIQLFSVSHGNIMQDFENFSSQKGVIQCQNISG